MATSEFMDNGTFFPTGRGAQQGGIAANMVIDGIEGTARSVVPVRDRRNGNDIRSKINFIRYADDFIITGDYPNRRPRLKFSRTKRS